MVSDSWISTPRGSSSGEEPSGAPFEVVVRGLCGCFGGVRANLGMTSYGLVVFWATRIAV
eukprot:1381913-Amorphochlora_amoeboformis.AAC.1